MADFEAYGKASDECGKILRILNSKLEKYELRNFIKSFGGDDSPYHMLPGLRAKLKEIFGTENPDEVQV